MGGGRPHHQDQPYGMHGGGTSEGNRGIDGPRVIEQSRRDEVLTVALGVHDVPYRQSGSAASTMAAGRERKHNRRDTGPLQALSAEARCKNRCPVGTGGGP